jgi:hypothetical protein
VRRPKHFALIGRKRRSEALAVKLKLRVEVARGIRNNIRIEIFWFQLTRHPQFLCE